MVFASLTQAALKGTPLQQALLYSAGVIGSTNLVGFGITATLRTERITDLLGTGAFVASSAACVLRTRHLGGWPIRARPLLLNAAIGIWGTRLAGYLFYRINVSGGDERLAAFFPKKGEGLLDSRASNFPVNLAAFWTIQALWAWIVSFPVTLSTFSPAAPKIPLGVGGGLALGCWAAGFLFECAADYQKFVFKQDPANRGKFIDTGVWSLSRHPNYFGEMVCWWSLWGCALPVLRRAGAKHVALGTASPVFLTFLLLCVSGVPLLEEKYKERYAGDSKYKAYVQRVPLVFPKLPF
ncbi:unnamed protein product [Chrysoparadoxa australica]